MPTDEPQFPLTIVWVVDGEVEVFDDKLNLICNLEDFDSTDASDRAQASITDALGRAVCVRVKIWQNLCECWLSDSTSGK